jgi:hypothetical protein
VTVDIHDTTSDAATAQQAVNREASALRAADIASSTSVRGRSR